MGSKQLLLISFLVSKNTLFIYSKNIHLIKESGKSKVIKEFRMNKSLKHSES